MRIAPRNSRLFAAVAASLSFLTLPAAAATNALLVIDGVPGESQAASHPRSIEVLSLGGEISPSTAANNGDGGRAARPCSKPFVVSKLVDRASPVLMGNALVGTIMPTATFYLSKSAGGSQANAEYLTIVLNQVTVVSTTLALAGDGSAPAEQVTFAFTSGSLSYKPQRPDCSFDPPIIAALGRSC
jgi:type VI secretion system secreted protein Hcp